MSRSRETISQRKQREKIELTENIRKEFPRGIKRVVTKFIKDINEKTDNKWDHIEHTFSRYADYSDKVYLTFRAYNDPCKCCGLVASQIYERYIKMEDLENENKRKFFN